MADVDDATQPAAEGPDPEALHGLEESASRHQPPPKHEALRMFMRNRAAVFGAVSMIAILVITFILPLFFSRNKLEIVAEKHLSPGSDGAPFFGSDYLGRDVGVIVMEGGSTTLKVAALAVVVIVVIGATVGAVAGYYGGWIDSALMRFTEFFQVLPGLLFAIVVVALFEANTLTIVLAIGLISWPGIARLTRAEFLRQKNLEFVKAAKAIGSSDLRIMIKTIMPNTLPVLIVQSTLIMGGAILFEAGLAFLGLGDPANLSWGFYVGLNRQFFLSNWWGVTFPGLMIFFTVLSLSLIGDGMQDAVNPKLRGR